MTPAELRELLAAATPGPWTIAGDEPGWRSAVASADEIVAATDSPSDAALIAALRNSAPALLDRVEALERALKPFAQRAHLPWCIASDGGDPCNCGVTAARALLRDGEGSR